MERYYSSDSKTTKRSEKNKELYRGIYDINEYSNIEAVATLDKTNEIDITKIKKLLKSREDYKKQREYQSILKKDEIEEPDLVEPKKIQTTSYDIKDALEKVENTKKDSAYRMLDDTSYNILKQLKIEKQEKNIEDDELQDMTSTSLLNKLDNEELSLNMFEDLASSGKTITTGKDSISALLEEAKKLDEKEENTIIDNSFYTSSLNIDSKDFEDLYDKDIKKFNSNTKIKIVVAIILFVILTIIVAMILNFK
jgi:hypothetical protein